MLASQLAGALENGDAVSLEPLARAAESLAPSNGESGQLWLLAARARRLRVDRFDAAASASDGAVSAELPSAEMLRALSAEARACAADARQAWSALAPDVAAKLAAGARPSAALALTSDPAAAEPLYLDALCSASAARAQGFTFFVDHRELAFAEMERASALAPSLDGGGPDRELARLLATLPASAGGDLAAARARFESAIARAPQSLWTRVLYARTLAVKLQDRPLFTQLLQGALAQPADDARAKAAQAEARALLTRGDDLFGVATAPR